MELLFNRFADIDFEYITTTVWSLGILVSGYRFQIPAENKFKILQVLN